MSNKEELQFVADISNVEKQSKSLVSFFEKVNDKVSDIEMKSANVRGGIAGLGHGFVGRAGGAFAQAAGSLISSQIHTSGKEQAVPAISGGVQGATTLLGTSLFGIQGAIVASVINKVTETISGAVSEKTEMIEGAARQQVQQIVSSYAIANQKVSEESIAQLLKIFREREERIYNSMRKVVQVQNNTSGSIMGKVGNEIQRGMDRLGQ